MNIKFYPLIVILLIVTIIGFVKEPELSPELSVKDEEWQLPEQKYSRPEISDWQKLKQLSLWQEDNVQEVSLGMKNWTLKGIVYKHEVPYILLMVKGEQKMLEFRQNQTLPNGETLLEILPDQIVFEYEGSRKTASLYSKI